MNSYNCRICSSDTQAVGSVYGSFSEQYYELRHCPVCRFSFVANPLLDFARIYDKNYYQGEGADPYVDYVFELEHPNLTVRGYEWRGLLTLVRSLVTLNATTRWLDFGCGNGGFVRFVRSQSPCQIVGFDEGWISDQATASGIPFLSRSQLEEQQACYDIITAIEVIEHIADPLASLQTMARLLRPGGILLLTTGNARPFRGRLPNWRYVIPEIHISFFEPETLRYALQKAGFQTSSAQRLPGWNDIIRFKLLKTLGVQQRHLFERLVPWWMLTPIVDARIGVSAHPIGRRQ